MKKMDENLEKYLIIGVMIIIIVTIICTTAIILTTNQNTQTTNANSTTKNTSINSEETYSQSQNPNHDTGSGYIGEGPSRNIAHNYIENTYSYSEVHVQSAHLTSIDGNAYYWMDVACIDSNNAQTVKTVYVGAYDGKIYDPERNNIS